MGIVEKWIKIIEEENFENIAVPSLSIYTPPVDVLISGSSLIVLVEIPGVSKEDMKLKISQDSLYLEGVKRSYSSHESYQYYNMERYAGRFRRVVKFPFPVDVDTVKAVYRDGVLEVEIRRKVEETKKIDIE